ncbi:MAG: DNA adenine methylase [Candidatus Anammoxibacter sp.]
MISNIKQVKNPVARIGSKGLIAKKIVALIPDHESYTESFAGSCAVLPAKKPSKIETINDKDFLVTGFYRIVKHSKKQTELVDLLTSYPYARTFHAEARARFKDGVANPVERSALWFYLSRSSHVCDIRSGGFAVAAKSRNMAFTYRNMVKAIGALGRRLENVVVECLDYKDFILRYDSSSVCHYIDSPYLNFSGCYDIPFTNQDHADLAKILNSIQGAAIVSYYDHPVIEELYKGWNRLEIKSVKMSHSLTKSDSSSRPKTIEVLYCNFDCEA